MLAVTLINLKSNRSPDVYKRYSKSFIKPGMNAMPSVKRFRDFLVTGAMGGGETRWQLMEVIEITSPAEFERDNNQDPGKKVADDWATWVEDYRVLYCDEIP